MDKMGKIRGVEVSRPERSAVPQTLYTPSRQSSASLLELFFLPELSLLPDITIVPAAQGHPAVQISPLCQCQPPRKEQELGLVTACGLVQPAVVSLGPDLESLISDVPSFLPSSSGKLGSDRTQGRYRTLLSLPRKTYLPATVPGVAQTRNSLWSPQVSLAPLDPGTPNPDPKAQKALYQEVTLCSFAKSTSTQSGRWPGHTGVSAGCNSAPWALHCLIPAPQALRFSSPSQKLGFPLWVPLKKVQFPRSGLAPETLRCGQLPADSQQCWLLVLCSPPYQAAPCRNLRPSSPRVALLTLVNLTSKLRMGRGKAGGFPSGCPFSTAPLVVAMTGSHSLVRVPDAPARPGRCAACSG